MKENIKITIVIAVRNMPETLGRAIESVLNQTYPYKELIVMDGASTDDTVDVIRKYENQLTYWVSEQDRGPSDAISKALPHASGELIGFLGADDWYEPYALELVAAAYQESHADLCYGNMMTRDGEICELKNLKKFSPDKLFMEGTQWLGAVCAFARKELLEANYKKKNDVLLTDYLFFLRLYAEGRTFTHIGDDRHITNFSIGGRTTAGIYRAVRDTEVVRKQFLEEYPHMREKYMKHAKRMEKAYAMGIADYYRQVLSKEQYREYVKELPCSGEDCILFGSGKQGRECAKLMKIFNIKIECFVDNDNSKWGQDAEGFPIKNPEILKEAVSKCVVVTPSWDFEEQIMKQLHTMGIEKKCRIIHYSDIAIQVYHVLGEEVLDDAWNKGLIS